VSIELAVPLSLASLEALLVEAGSTMGAIPLDAVRRVLRLTPAQIGRSGQGQSIVHGGRAIPFVTLAQVMGEPPPTTPRNTTAVIVDSAGTLAAVGVDRLVSTSTLVLRPLPELTPACPLVAGASMDVEGNPRLLFDPEGLVRQAQCGGLPAPAPQAARVPVLVIDDSLTTRMLEQSILESAGYEVHLAVSAEDGLEQARARPYALFLVDVEMPGMDGFSFIERTQAEPALRGVPAVLVTSRSSPEDLRRGQDVGARGYIVKSEFAQAEFLERVRQLVAQS
jgi:two-component system, chemotaxis family, sensor kinase CheA